MTDAPLGKSKYDYDPDAHDWARAKVEGVRDKFQRFADEAVTEQEKKQWRTVVFALNRELIGGDGCVITAFDHRRAKLLATIDEVEAP